MILCFFLWVISPGMAVATEPLGYWVLGSFSSPRNAEVEQQRLASLLGAPLEVRRSNQGEHYRVLIQAGRIPKAALTAQSLVPWMLKLDAADTEAASSMVSDLPASGRLTSHESTPVSPSSADIAEPSPLYEPLQPAESLADYCTRLPDSRLCLHPLSGWALRHEERLTRGQQSLQAACRQPQSGRAREICRQWQNPQ